MQNRLWRFPSFLFGVVFPAFAAAQFVVSPRITAAVDEVQLVRLAGNTHPLARPEYDRGAAPSRLPTRRMLLVLKRSQRQGSCSKPCSDPAALAPVVAGVLTLHNFLKSPQVPYQENAFQATRASQGKARDAVHLPFVLYN
jgi:hypothetical protein